ncbi:hypothetical protein QN362_04360 [Actimicrobium sp. CCC2.4]|uniref:hypothetical protein n=1 Tax=Actimicrobium sp. CCC2.4 TaxID=3048606 RepID=UPI002AC9726C|nr:hypothetical protein [Actimicrobium sp. CCC2.4]MEB0134561.1 hypothetical protein [Actimicrobium sp. CCC2.4]WPX34003.1 hypothetical protein RHM62_09440 [Actimicrobium sp. CCC2.4]
MARPARTTTEQVRGKMRAVALLSELARRVGAENPHQFAKWFDEQSGMNTQMSGKWRLNFSGKQPLSPQQLQLLSRRDGDVARLHKNGPAELWRALWGAVCELWPLCRSRFTNDGPMLNDHIWSAVEGEFVNEKPFGSALREFEGELLLADAYREPLTLRHLTEAIAFYRLHQHINSLAPSEVDGVGLYRCVRMCLDDIGVFYKLTLLGIYDDVASELEDMEFWRLRRDKSRRMIIAADDLADYVGNPRAFVTDDSRWESLNFDWAS